KIPAGIQGDLVIGKPERPLLCLRQAEQRNDGHFNQASGLGGKQAAVTGDNPTFRIDEDRIGEPELRNRGFDLLDLAFGMGTGIAGVGDQLADGPVGETEIVRFLLSTHYSLLFTPLKRYTDIR